MYQRILRFFLDQNTVWNMAKIQFEKYEKFEKIQNFEICDRQIINPKPLEN